MAWMLQPHSYTQIVRRNLYNVPYRRTGAYKGMGQIDPGGTDVYQLTDPSGNLLPVSQYLGSTFPTTPTNWLPWVIGGVLVFALIAGGRR